MSFLEDSLSRFLGGSFCNCLNRILRKRATSNLETQECMCVEPLASRILLNGNIFGDFNNDGFDDLVIGVPDEDIAGNSDAGAVNVIYGSANGLTSAGNQIWHQNRGLIGRIDNGDNFGSSLAVGDFNNDNFDDLAVGIPDYEVRNLNNAGAVNIIYGSASGLTATGNQLWHQNSPGVNEVAEEFDNFGTSLAAGDFNNDGNDDLAIGVPRENIPGVADAGAVNVLYGTASGLSSTGDQLWTQDRLNSSVAENFDDFGFALATGDFNGDDFDDLAVGVPKENIGAIANAGAVNIIYGKSTGLRGGGNQFIHQDSTGIIDQIEANDRYGFSLAAGDFNGDNNDDLAIGVPFEDFNGMSNPGIVNVLYGTPSRIQSTGNQVFSQDQNEFTWAGGVAENGDQFGYSLAVGKFNNGNLFDLAIGVPFENINNIEDAGAINVVFGRTTGLGGRRVFSQNTVGVLDVSQINDRFGFSIGAGDFNNDGFSDLVIGVPQEDLGNTVFAGAVNVLYGSSSGLTAVDDQFWHQNSPGIRDVAEQGDNFGWSVPIGRIFS